MADDATLNVVVKLRDLFSKEFKALGTTVTGVGRTMRDTMRSSFQAVHSSLTALVTPFKRVIGFALDFKTLLLGYVSTQAVRGLAELAAKTDDLSRGFRSMTRTIGADSVSALERLRKATNGMLPDMELMEKANTAIMLGAVKSEGELEKLARYALILGNAMGRSAKDSLESFTIGLSRQSPMILDNLGLTIKLEEAMKSYAAANGLAADALTEEQQKQAFSFYVWKLAEEKVKALGGGITGLSVTFGQFSTAIETAKVALAQGFAPVLAAIAEELTRWLRENMTAIRAWAAEWGGALAVIAKGVMETFKRIWSDWGLLWRLAKHAATTLWDYFIGVSQAKLGYFGAWLRAEIKRVLRVVVLDGVMTMGNVMSQIWGMKSFGEAILDKFSSDYTGIEDEFRAEIKRITEIETETMESAREEIATGWERFLVMAVGGEKLQDLRKQWGAAMTKAQDIRAGKDLADTAKSIAAVREEAEATPGVIDRLVDSLKNLKDAAKSGLDDFLKEFGDTFKNLHDAVYDTMRALTSTVSDVFFDAMTAKMKSFKEYLRSFLLDVARAISDFMAKQVVAQFFTQILGVGASAISGLFASTPSPAGGGGGGGGAAGMHGEPVEGPFMAEGGIATGPAVVGEAGVPEAYVPLPGNRHIPVDLRGGGSTRSVTVNFHISAVDGPSVQRMLAAQGKTISQIIQDALGRDQQLRAAVQAV